MPQPLCTMASGTLQCIGYNEHRFIFAKFDFPDMPNLIRQAHIPVVMADETIQSIGGIPSDTRRLGLVGPHETAGNNGLVDAVHPYGVMGRGAAEIFAPFFLELRRSSRVYVCSYAIRLGCAGTVSLVLPW